MLAAEIEDVFREVKARGIVILVYDDPGGRAGSRRGSEGHDALPWALPMYWATCGSNSSCMEDIALPLSPEEARLYVQIWLL